MTEKERLKEIERIAKGTFSTWTDKPRPHIVSGETVYDTPVGEVYPRSTSDGLNNLRLKLNLETVIPDFDYELYQHTARGNDALARLAKERNCSTGIIYYKSQKMRQQIRDNRWLLK